uniref:Uncharacterized protein n=1 Tax=Dechloromonas aromatica (strain RCB) TaxID=159087 RepID=Q479B3_DECAR
MDMKVSAGGNISSLIRGVLPAEAEQVAAQWRLLPWVEVHAAAEIPDAVVYMHPDNAKKLGLARNEVAKA